MANRAFIYLALLLLSTAATADCGVVVTGSMTFRPHEPARSVPEASYLDSQGERRPLNSLDGVPRLVNFWGTWCPPCVKEVPSLDRLVSDSGQWGLKVLAPAWERTGGFRQVNEFLNRLSVGNLDAALDPEGEAARAFRVRTLPTTVLIDRHNGWVGTFVGGVDWDSPVIRQLIANCLD